MYNIDKYNLKASDVFSISSRQEQVTNLQLTLSTISNEGIITGTVTSNGQPLADAIVKVFDTNFIPIAHANTGPQGQYNIPSVVKGSYLVTATKNGYLTPLTIPVSVTTNNPTIVNISLTPDPNAVLNTLYGKLREEVTLAPISDAIVNIYSIVNSQTSVIATTKTNSSGQYLSPNLPNGNYLVDANKPGYFQIQSQPITLINAEIAALDLVMPVDPLTNTGTINGIITDQATLNPIPGASVALYTVIGNSEVITQVTQTNLGGRYLFGNVVAGTYIVKAFGQNTTNSLVNL